MYDDLVKRLRNLAEWADRNECEVPLTLSYRLQQAADAIEELSNPRWIPVTERLPEDGSLVGKLIADSDGNIRIASQCAEVTLSGGKTVYTDLIDLVSLLAEDTPTTEWEDCTHITHWMPLPEPPKEKEMDERKCFYCKHMKKRLSTWSGLNSFLCRIKHNKKVSWNDTCDEWESQESHKSDQPKEEAPATDTNVPTYDLLYEEGGYNSNGV